MISIEIGVGELFDRVSILSIKRKNISDELKLKNIETEYQYLSKIMEGILENVESKNLYLILLHINYSLWEIEDRLRVLEKKNKFDELFIKNARLVYKLNDERASIKKRINILYGSKFIEEKSYKGT